ncbi:ankyrin homolog [Plakobranchus ocellatus]|uniref:Ankyrin homolog n=1 Tax=Plakobranchus ocellatus TaxID=259542 RepID=A0AAV4AZ67_9GAST|nr:ankyrin homolog [Plakobranchus ocellatus]
MVNKLITAGTHLDVRNDEGLTPLMLAAKFITDERMMATITMLKDNGADLTAVDKVGNTFLHLMVQSWQCLNEKTLRLLGCDNLVSVINRQTKYGMTPLMLAAEEQNFKAIKVLLELGADPNIVDNASWETCAALSIVLENGEKVFVNKNTASDCTELLIIHNALSSLPECCYSHFHRMIIRDQRRFVQLMVTHGMPPLCKTVRTFKDFMFRPHMEEYIGAGKFSPIAVAVLYNNITVAQYMLENWFLTPADVVGSSELQHLRSKLKRRSQVESLSFLEENLSQQSLRFIEENLSQPMSLFQLSFVAVSAQLGGMAGREERVRKIPLPQIIQDILLFQHATSLLKNSGSPTGSSA